MFRSATGQPLTRFGIYKIVRRHAEHLDDARAGRRVSPHLFRHTAAVHLLEAGVEVNVIRAWLGHADLTTTNRYAEITTRAKIEALRNTEPTGCFGGTPPSPDLEDPTKRCSTGCHRSERLCAGAAGQPAITAPQRRRPHNPVGNRNTKMFRGTFSRRIMPGTPPRYSNART